MAGPAVRDLPRPLPNHRENLTPVGFVLQARKYSDWMNDLYHPSHHHCMDKPNDKEFPGRKTLPHNPPLGIDISRETFFITICLANRFSKISLAKEDIARPLIDTVAHRNKNHTWWCSTFVVMPDHVHGLFRFPNDSERNRTMQKTMGNWKSWTARSLGIKWQRGWFDHRLRSDEKERETAEYICNNPVRSGLAKTVDAWPYRFVADS